MKSGCRVLNGKLNSNRLSHDAPIYAILTLHVMVVTGLIRQRVNFIKKTLQMENVDTSDFALMHGISEGR